MASVRCCGFYALFGKQAYNPVKFLVGGFLQAAHRCFPVNNEEQDVKKSIMMIVGACIFLVAAAQALPLFFGVGGN